MLILKTLLDDIISIHCSFCQEINDSSKHIYENCAFKIVFVLFISFQIPCTYVKRNWYESILSVSADEIKDYIWTGQDKPGVRTMTAPMPAVGWNVKLKSLKYHTKGWVFFFLMEAFLDL